MDETYLSCVRVVRNELITSTAAISALASFLMGLLANLPVGMAPGMGLNAYVRVPRDVQVAPLTLFFVCCFFFGSSRTRSSGSTVVGRSRIGKLSQLSF
jgi:xanthine/uracil/vitamin C permease (AzgA family)